MWGFEFSLRLTPLGFGQKCRRLDMTGGRGWKRWWVWLPADLHSWVGRIHNPARALS